MIRTLLKDSSLFLLSTIISKASMFLVTIMVSRFLGTEVFGQMSLIRGFVSTLEVYTAMGINHSTTKAIAEVKDFNYNPIVNKSFFITLFNLVTVITLMLLFGNYITYFLFKTNDVNFIFALKSSMILLFFVSFMNLFNSIFLGLESYHRLAKSAFYSSILFVPIALYLINSFELIGTIYAISSFFIIQSLFMLYYMRETISNFVLNLSFSKESFVERWHLIKISLPLFFSMILIIGVHWYGKTMLVNPNDNSFNEVAFFEASYQWLMIVIVLTSSVSNISLSKFSKLFINKNSNDLKKMLKLNIAINISISLFSLVVVSIYADEIMGIYGTAYKAHSEVLTLLLLSSIPLTANGVFVRFFVSINKNLYNLYGSILWTTVFVLGLNYCKTIDAYSLAIIFNISYFILFIFSLFAVYNYFSIKKETR